ncbi:MAG: tetratricopeptide repeat protein [Magnetococcus sp. YQC-5]
MMHPVPFAIDAVPVPLHRRSPPVAKKSIQSWLHSGGIAMIFGVLSGGFFLYRVYLDEIPLTQPIRKEQSQVVNVTPVPVMPAPMTLASVLDAPPDQVTARPPAQSKRIDSSSSDIMQHLFAQTLANLKRSSLPEDHARPPRTEPMKPAALTGNHARTARTEPMKPASYLFLTSRPNPVHAARKAFLAGDLVTAKKRYLAHLAQNPHHHVALAGMASIAIRENQLEQARTIYQDILRDNPRHTLALASLITLTAHVDPEGLIKQLKTLLSGTAADAVHLQFALGTIYAEQNNWSAAQNAFFVAATQDSGNPDVLCNLAVTLDRQGQYGRALHYYREAIKVMGFRGGAGFDRDQVERRVTLLEQKSGSM